MNGYLIDSDILIDYLRGQERARAFLLEVSKKMTLWISIISIIEIYSGEETKDLQKLNRVGEFLNNFEIVWLSLNIAKRAGELRRDYQKPFADSIIAAGALEYDLRLITRNVKHFDLIKDLKLLKPY